MNQKQKKARNTKIMKQYQTLRDQFWPNIDKSDLWSRHEKDGFTTIPRTMPYFDLIMDMQSKGKPLSSVYLTLWCRVWEHSIIIIENYEKMAFEAGFTGQRAITTWKERMKRLVELGFIDAKPGVSGDFHYVLIFNPYLVVKKLSKKGLIEERYYSSLFHRATEIGADEDLIEKASPEK